MLYSLRVIYVKSQQSFSSEKATMKAHFLGEALRCFCTEMFNSALNCGKESVCVKQPASGEYEGSDLK